MFFKKPIDGTFPWNQGQQDLLTAWSVAGGPSAYDAVGLERHAEDVAAVPIVPRCDCRSIAEHGDERVRSRWLAKSASVYTCCASPVASVQPGDSLAALAQR